MNSNVKIVRFHEFGGPDVLKVELLPLPEPGEGEARLRVKAIGLNRAELLFRQGLYLFEPTLPAKIGVEASGVVEAVGSNVDPGWIGRNVSCIPSFSPVEYGVYGEAAIVPVSSLSEYPDSLSFEDAAAIWAQYLTAWGALIHFGQVTASDFVLITAASSSTGLAAIQMAKAEGATVIATTRTRTKRDELLRCGADYVIVTDEEKLGQRVKEITRGCGVRIVYDPIGGSGVDTLVEAVAKGGIIFLYGMLSPEATVLPLFPGFLKYLTVKVYDVHQIMEDSEALAAGASYILPRLGSGALKPVIGATFKLEEIVGAHRFMEANTHIGKIVVKTNA